MLRLLLLLLVAVCAFAQNGNVIDGLLNGSQINGTVPASSINPGGCATGYYPNGTYTAGVANCSQVLASQISGTFTLAQLPASVLSNSEVLTGTSTSASVPDVLFSNASTPGSGHTMFGVASNGGNGIYLQRGSTSYQNEMEFATGTGGNDIWLFGTIGTFSDLSLTYWNGTSTTAWLSLSKANSLITASQPLVISTGGVGTTPMMGVSALTATGYATYSLKNSGGQAFQFALGGPSVTGGLANTFYLYDNNTSVAALTVAPTTDNITIAKNLAVTGTVSAPEHISSVNTVTFSATPAFDVSLGALQKITLTAAVTSSTISNLTAGEVVTFQICENATGGFPFAWPTNVHGGITVGTNASTCSMQQFASWDGSNLYPVSVGVINIP